MINLTSDLFSEIDESVDRINSDDYSEYNDLAFSEDDWQLSSDGLQEYSTKNNEINIESAQNDFLTEQEAQENEINIQESGLDDFNHNINSEYSENANTNEEGAAPAPIAATVNNDDSSHSVGEIAGGSGGALGLLSIGLAGAAARKISKSNDMYVQLKRETERQRETLENQPNLQKTQRQTEKAIDFK